MRDFRFRAWIPSSHWIAENEGENSFYVYDWQDTIYVEATGFQPGEGVVIEQFTGLKDKNGRKIFEGDIVQYHSDSNPVFFNEKKACFNVKDYYDSNQDYPTMAFSENLPCVVIGNIHDNN